MRDLPDVATLAGVVQVALEPPARYGRIDLEDGREDDVAKRHAGPALLLGRFLDTMA